MKNAPDVTTILAAVLVVTCCVQAASTAPEDNISYIDNGTLRLGVNLDLGGSITYLADANDGTNMINNHDWGRQIQMSFYSGPNPFTPGGKQPSQTWAGLGWNPIQSGDYAGNRSTVVAHHNDGDAVYVKCIPMQWPLDNEPGECTFESWIKLQGNTVHVRSRIDNHRADTTQYSGRGQELPAVYTNGPWYRLISYAGDRPFTDDKVRRFTKTWTSFEDVQGSPWEHWVATEHWAALLNDNNRGLGVFKWDTCSFVGGFFGTPGAGGSKDAPTGYISPVQDEILDHNIGYEYEYVLIVGTLEEIRQYARQHSRGHARPDYHFQSDRQHWTYRNAVDTGWPIRGYLHVLLESNDPQLIGPTDPWQAADVPKLYVEAACETDQSEARIFWKTHAQPHFTEDSSLAFQLTPDGRYHLYELDLASCPKYTGMILGLRLDPAATGRKGDYIKIKTVSWKK